MALPGPAPLPFFVLRRLCFVSQQVRVHSSVVHDGGARRGHRRAFRVLGAGQGVQQVSEGGRESQREIENGMRVSALRDLRCFLLKNAVVLLLLLVACRGFVDTPQAPTVVLFVCGALLVEVFLFLSREPEGVTLYESDP